MIGPDLGAFARDDTIEAHRLAARAARQLVSVDRLNALVLAGRAALCADHMAAAVQLGLAQRERGGVPAPLTIEQVFGNVRSRRSP